MRLCAVILTFALAGVAQAQNIVLISVDTLRADHLPAYGYRRISTPAIDRLRGRGALFSTCISSVPLTLPSHCSILTGLYPPHHGVRDNGGFYLSENDLTLAEVLSRSGYSTAAFVGAFVLAGRFGLNQGFDLYDDDFDLSMFENQALDAIQRRGGEVMARALGWIDRQRGHRFFAFIHLYDPHSPYEAPEPFLSRYRGQEFGLYDGEIAYVDSLIAELIDHLDSRSDTTAVVFTSDHGEGLGEHGEGAHGYFVYDSTIRVPLIISAEGVHPGATVSSLVRTVDIFPTILEIAGVASPPGTDGKSLLGLAAGRREEARLAYAESLYPQFHYRWAPLRAARSASMKYIETTSPELYKLDADAGEKRNVYSVSAPPQLEGYLRDNEAGDRSPRAAVAPDQQTLDALQALGYIGAQLPAQATHPLPDPKDKLPLFNLLRLASDDSLKKDYGSALEKIDAVLRQDRDVIEAHLLQGNIRYKQSRFDLALSSYKAALAIEPAYVPALYGSGLCQKELGQIAAADETFTALHRIDPRNARAVFTLGDLAFERERYDQAAVFFRQALALGSDAPQTHKRLGDSLVALGRLDEAESEYRATASLKPMLPGLHYGMALLAEAHHDVSAAEAEYRQELRTNPAHIESMFNLGILLMKSNRSSESLVLFRECAAGRPKWAQGKIFLAKAIADSSGSLLEAEKIAREGITLAEDVSTRRFGHLVLADILNAMGRAVESQQEMQEAGQLQQ